MVAKTVQKQKSICSDDEGYTVTKTVDEAGGPLLRNTVHRQLSRQVHLTHSEEKEPARSELQQAMEESCVKS